MVYNHTEVQDMETFDLKECSITGGFFADYLKRNADVTMDNVYRRFEETGRFAALKCKKTDVTPHYFWDSDVFKWLEAAAYLLARKDDAVTRRRYDAVVDDIVRGQQENGYFNSYFSVCEPDGIFSERHKHELYCAGHLFEAAVAAAKYLGDDRLLKVSEKFADYIALRFCEKRDTGFITPGHEEIELALYKLYDYTGKEKFKTLADFFLCERGKRAEKDIIAPVRTQSHLPVKAQTEGVGHAVRAAYLYCAMADAAAYDKDYLPALEKIYDNISRKREYVTGGIGNRAENEGFSFDYDLDNFSAYSETCAAIGYAFFCHRMFKLTGDVKYADKLEKLIYNAAIASVSLDGKSFFYVNPLEMNIGKLKYNDTLEVKDNLPIAERMEVFGCSCCPPNVLRFIEQLPEFIFYKNDGVTVAQPITSSLKSDVADIEIYSELPYGGKVRISVDAHGREAPLRVRVPEWCREDYGCDFLRYDVKGKSVIELDFTPRLKTVYANPSVRDAAGKVAFTYGPLVLCAEGKDNDRLFDIRPRFDGNYEIDKGSIFTVSIPAVRLDAKDLYSYNPPCETPCRLKLIPYFAWANRGANDMRVWFTV